MCDVWELLHVGADFGQDACSRFFLDAGDALQKLERFRESWVFHPAEDLLIERLHLALQELQMSEGMTDEEALMIGESVAGDGCGDFWDLHSGLFLG